MRARIAFYFCGYLALLLTVYSGAFIAMFRFAEDRAFNRQVAEISNRLARHIDALSFYSVSRNSPGVNESSPLMRAMNCEHR